MVYGSSASSRCAAGPKIAAIGGGTGLSTMLRGLKKYTDRLTAIVTVADDGGGSGVLRREMGILPPGDVRQCMQALANTEPVMEQLLGYRFPEGQLKGQSFGNLLLAALGIALAEYPLLSAQGGYARHDPALLAQAVMELYRERTVRIYRGTQQYITEEQEWK